MAEYTPYPVQVITPEGTAFTGDAQIVVVPGDAGPGDVFRAEREVAFSEALVRVSEGG